MTAGRRTSQGLPTPSLPQRLVGAKEVLWMRDITRLTGVHRSTIVRWIRKGQFPRRGAPCTSLSRFEDVVEFYRYVDVGLVTIGVHRMFSIEYTEAEHRAEGLLTWHAEHRSRFYRT
jgi:hypothetical protein